MSEQPAEDELVPHRASPLVGGRLLVLAAHPDDETFGAGGALASQAGQAEAIRVWIATDGERQEGADADPSAYAAVRREEAREAAARLGLAAPVFAGLPDRELSSRRAELAALLVRQIRELEPDLILCPSPVEIHPDHRALAETVYELVAASRPGDVDHDVFRFVRVAYYELTQPVLPNALVDIAPVAARKRDAVAAYVSQQAVRDYAAALEGLNAYRRLTLQGSGPVEAFCIVAYPEISSRSLEEFRRSIGPALVAESGRASVPVSVVVRTRNRPALLAEALESLRAQTARPAQVIVVNDGGAPVAEVATAFRDAFEIELLEGSDRGGRSVAANRGVEAARSELVAFLDDDDRCYPDHLERLARAFRAGPEPVVYSDAATVVYERRDDRWVERLRTLQYSLDFDPDYLLLANYIPIHTLLLPRALYRQAGGFDPKLEYSEDWDFLIRLSLETPFRHVRGVTCEYRVFSSSAGDPTHVPAGQEAFQRARAEIYSRYANRRSEEGLARSFDRMRAQIAFCSERDGISQGELRYQRESHRRLNATLARTGESLEQRVAELSAARLRSEGLERDVARRAAESAQLLAENELVHARVAELFASNEEYHHKVAQTQAEIQRLDGILSQIYRSRTWKLHLLLERLRGRSS